ncbi:estradiol 17 beta-dehydrogenase 5-like isoform X2 [Phyllobates terribilis]|uniref:estradiol 17 beta-dehydrogenase 5-like isoform X2 n=1 Tax=Phyllobates terribilis TaxID=111132 RepID=UPI003CCABFB3
MHSKYRIYKKTARERIPDVSDPRRKMELREGSYITLIDGHKMPVIGFGTYAPRQFPKNLAEDGVKVALEVGYRHIDSAFIYGNEAEVGQAIKQKIADGTVKREDVFYTGKLWSTFQAPDRVRPALEESLKDLDLDYMDLFLIHTPIELKPGDDLFPTDENGKLIYHNTDIREIWKVECHIYLNQSKLLEFLKSHGIVLVAYSVLGSSREEDWTDQNAPVLLEDPVLNSIAEKLTRTPAQVALRYLLQRGIIVLAKSFTPTRIKQNFQVFDFQLSDEEMKTLDGLNKNIRYLNTHQWQDHPKYPFHDEY